MGRARVGGEGMWEWYVGGMCRGFVGQVGRKGLSEGLSGGYVGEWLWVTGEPPPQCTMQGNIKSGTRPYIYIYTYSYTHLLAGRLSSEPFNSTVVAVSGFGGPQKHSILARLSNISKNDPRKNHYLSDVVVKNPSLLIGKIWKSLKTLAFC